MGGGAREVSDVGPDDVETAAGDRGGHERVAPQLAVDDDGESVARGRSFREGAGEAPPALPSRSSLCPRPGLPPPAPVVGTLLLRRERRRSHEGVVTEGDGLQPRFNEFGVLALACRAGRVVLVDARVRTSGSEFGHRHRGRLQRSLTRWVGKQVGAHASPRPADGGRQMVLRRHSVCSIGATRVVPCGSLRHVPPLRGWDRVLRQAPGRVRP